MLDSAEPFPGGVRAGEASPSNPSQVSERKSRRPGVGVVVSVFSGKECRARREIMARCGRKGGAIITHSN